ncbi:lactonase family protein [Pollutibacter soli]|uniref:lactonase family protein n=1 Tax=Pollutibacter soli TaxID=3034157 RepID=UPI00301405F2
MSEKEILYIGTYTPKGEGIYVYKFDPSNFEFEQIQVAENKKSPTFLAFHPSKRILYAADEGAGLIESYHIDPVSKKLTAFGEKPAQGNGPCHISVDPKGRFVYVSNYGSGDLAVYHLLKDGSFGELADSIQNVGTGDQKPHMHSIIPSSDGKFIYASDLGVDKVFIYEVDGSTGKLKPASTASVSFAPGAGPRHFDIHPNGRYAYSAAELNNTVVAFKRDPKSGSLAEIQTINMLPEGFSGKSSAADIHISPDGKFVYASNRGDESIVMYAIDQSTGKLALAGHEKTNGKHPRNFLMDSKGKFILVANKDTDNIVVFTRDAKTGKLTNTSKQLSVPNPVCILQLTTN